MVKTPDTGTKSVPSHSNSDYFRKACAQAPAPTAALRGILCLRGLRGLPSPKM